jgi:hypothetical protein
MACEGRGERYKANLEKLNDRYWDDAKFRQRKNEENRARSRERVICSECQDEFAYGSMSAHRRRCRGLEGFTILEKLFRLK